MGVLYTFLPLLLIIFYSQAVNGVVVYTYTAWGFRRCSFRLVGACESLQIVERVTRPAPRPFYLSCSSNHNYLNR